MADGVVLPLAVRAQLRAHQPAPKMPDGQPREPEALAFDGHYTIVSQPETPALRKKAGVPVTKATSIGEV